MALYYESYPIDPYNINVTYFGEKVKFPFQYKIKIIPKEGVTGINNVDFEITEMNTLLTGIVGKEKLIKGMAIHKDIHELGVFLFGTPTIFVKNLDNYDSTKLDNFIRGNIDQFTDLLRKYDLEAGYVRSIAILEILSHFGESLNILWSDILAQELMIIKKKHNIDLNILEREKENLDTIKKNQPLNSSYSDEPDDDWEKYKPDNYYYNPDSPYADDPLDYDEDGERGWWAD